MKKIILLALSALMMVGCGYKNQDSSHDTPISVVLETIVIDIDSCEYIYGFNRLAHKGNCITQ